MSQPLWKDQPQHTYAGEHDWLRYVDSEGNEIRWENVQNTIDSYGPTYADVKMDYLSADGKIKVSYTHMEMPQLDENRTYYVMEYEVLDTVNGKTPMIVELKTGKRNKELCRLRVGCVAIRKS